MARPPEGYKKLPRGHRCRCPHMYQYKGDLYCCVSARTEPALATKADPVFTHSTAEHPPSSTAPRPICFDGEDEAAREFAKVMR